MRFQDSRRHGRALRLRGLGGEGELGRVQRNPRKGAGTKICHHDVTFVGIVFLYRLYGDWA